MRNWLLSILCLLAMLGAGVATEARLLVADAEIDAVEIAATEQVSDSPVASKGTSKSTLDRLRHGRLRHPARAHGGNGPTIALAATSWNWQPRFRLLTLSLAARAAAPFVRSVTLATPTLRAPPRG